MKNLDQELYTRKKYIIEVIKELQNKFYDSGMEYKRHIKKSHNDPDKAFTSGVRHGYCCALEALRNQAIVFHIPLKDRKSTRLNSSH